MNEVLLEKGLAARPRELGAVACAGCPFAELGCPKQGTGDCPPPQYIESTLATTLLENESTDQVWASPEGGYYATILPLPMEKPKKELLGDIQSVRIEQGKVAITRKNKVTHNERISKLKGRSLGEFVAELLLSVKKAK